VLKRGGAITSEPFSRLPARRGAVLRVIIREYVDKATPIGSEHLARAQVLGVSSATIRNEMAALEDEGYITHPHTSAGRIPSDKGYRYFVEALMESDRLPPQTQERVRSRILELEGERARRAHGSDRMGAAGADADLEQVENADRHRYP